MHDLYMGKGGKFDQVVTVLNRIRGCLVWSRLEDSYLETKIGT
jgi:hypothetical protein